MNVIASPRRVALDRRFYGVACVAAFAAAFAGFARTYYLKFLFGTPALPWLVHLHGALMTSWFVLFSTQTCLILRSFRESEGSTSLYQEGPLSAVLHPDELIERYGRGGYGLTVELHDPATGSVLRHRYCVQELPVVA